MQQKTSENRYGFNGKEKDDEVKNKEGSQIDYGFRIDDTRLGRFLSVDPLTKKYPELTPYQVASNNPISGIDLDGLEFYYTANGALLGKIGKSTEVRVVKDNDIKAIQSNINIVNANKQADYAEVALNEVNKFSTSLGVDQQSLVAFAAVIDKESSGKKDESYAIGNVTMNYIDKGGSTRGLKTLEDVVLYDNTFAQGATQKNHTNFKGKSVEEQNSKSAIGAAINAIGNSKKLGGFGFNDITNGATGWDGKDLIREYKGGNSHRKYIWSSDSKNLLQEYQKKFGDGTVNVSNWNYSSKSYQDKATSIIGGTLYQQVQGSRTEYKQNKNKFQ